MQIEVHPRVQAKRPEIEPDDVRAAMDASLRSRDRDTDPPSVAGVGLDGKGRLLEFIAVEVGPDRWLVYHACAATKAVMREVGLR